MIEEKLQHIRAAIADAERAAGRALGSVRLVAASKGQPPSAVQAAARLGQGIFGENYAREMCQKRLETSRSPGNLEWHFIGRVQASNAKDIASAVLVHGVGSLAQARALAKRGPVAVLLQVSLWGEATKNGFNQSEIERDLPVLREMQGLHLRGLMAMPPSGPAPRQAFAAVRELRDALAPELPDLSMGMSADFCEAILEGATLVRIGTALFGARPPHQEPA